MNLFRIFYAIFLIPHWVCYLLSTQRTKIDADIIIFFNNWQLSNKKSPGNIYNVTKALMLCKEFRNIFYARIIDISGKIHLQFCLQCILPKHPSLSIGTPSKRIGKGLYIEHGSSTFIHAKSIGEFCWINQNVTIGNNNRGIPEIGDNVRIGAGAVVLGPIKLGDNVVIGANATIVKDIPSDCTVVSSGSFVIKRNGIRVHENL